MIIQEWTSDYKYLRKITDHFVNKESVAKIQEFYRNNQCEHTQHIVRQSINIAIIAVEEFSLGNTAVCAILAYAIYLETQDLEYIENNFGKEVANLIHGLIHIRELHSKTSTLETENFRKLLLTFAEDIRVIFIMISLVVFRMRNITLFDKETKLSLAHQSSYLYAPMAHRMGLYKVKTELEDLSLKYTQNKIYKDIAKSLNEKKTERELYINNFINPLKEKIEKTGINFSIKGRTKSIYSIWNKMQKQQTNVDGIYDLFAIRIIIDCPLEQEKALCWQVYSIITDKYQPNPKRMRDWLSIPKTNGYESLHTTVLGPEGKWVEVQIRTQRMDEIAEKGLAAHWRYKGIKSEGSQMDEWVKNLRSVLESPELKGKECMDEFKLNLYNKEVFVFTPSGDLHQLPKGATLLDFAFSIHTQVGSSCVGGKIGKRNVTLKYKLENGDQIEVITSPNQKAKADWLNIVVTSKAKTKIRQVIKETQTKEANEGREIFLRRLKNWKIEFDEARLSRLVKKLSYKTISELYIDIVREEIDLLELRESYLNFDKPAEDLQQEQIKASDYEANETKQNNNNDTLIINNETKGVQYSMAKCCHPIFGDDIFGFVSINGGIKIHRKDCPNAPQLISRYGYRIVKATWDSNSDEGQICPLFVVGDDNLSIMGNISSLISKENYVTLRSISIDSNGNNFEGRLVLTVKDTKNLDSIIQKLRAIKGVISVSRI